MNTHKAVWDRPGAIMVSKYVVGCELCVCMLCVGGCDFCPIKRSRFEEAVKVVWNGLMKWPICPLGPW